MHKKRGTRLIQMEKDRSIGGKPRQRRTPLIIDAQMALMAFKERITTLSLIT
jgi:hypothetical protein